MLFLIVLHSGAECVCASGVVFMCRIEVNEDPAFGCGGGPNSNFGNSTMQKSEMYM